LDEIYMIMEAIYISIYKVVQIWPDWFFFKKP
jgi:hypothetical protein